MNVAKVPFVVRPVPSDSEAASSGSLISGHGRGRGWVGAHHPHSFNLL